MSVHSCMRAGIIGAPASAMEPSASSGASGLPDVCVERILAFLPAFPSVWTARRVSKQWQRCGALHKAVAAMLVRWAGF